MWRRLAVALAILGIAGCAQLPPTPQDIEAKQFRLAPGKSVIYIVRTMPDLSPEPASILLDEKAGITTYPGTYHRWEVEPGRHRISGLAGDSGVITLQTDPDRFYYVQQVVNPFMPLVTSSFGLVSEPAGRAVVMRSKLVP